MSAPVATIQTGRWEHAISAYSPPKYPRGFQHFEYVNPAAPKGGTLNLRNPDRRSSFDKFNPFTTRGSSPAGVAMFMFEPLAIQSMDEPQAMYGVLAEEIFVAPDLSLAIGHFPPTMDKFDRNRWNVHIINNLWHT